MVVVKTVDIGPCLGQINAHDPIKSFHVNVTMNLSDSEQLRCVTVKTDDV